jgi:hypothetical protein
LLLLAKFKRSCERIAGVVLLLSLFASGRGFLAIQFLAHVLNTTTAQNALAPDEPIRVGLSSWRPSLAAMSQSETEV